MKSPKKITPRNHLTGQIDLEGLHDATVVGISLINKSSIVLTISKDEVHRELHVEGEQNVIVIAQGAALPVIISGLFLNPPEEGLYELMNEQELSVVNSTASCYLSVSYWLLIITATYGDGFVVAGSGHTPQIYW